MRIAIVNDLALAREALRRVVASVPGYAVAWTAADGDEAVRRTAEDRPDAILMDLVMPRLDGAEATRRIMRQSPCPILVVTATVPGHFDLVYRAMGAGALDAVETPTFAPDGSIINGRQLADRLRKLERAMKNLPQSGTFSAPSRNSQPGTLPPIVAVGVSTGGPAALPVILESLPVGFPAAVLIVQHLDAAFLPGLAHQLATRCRLPVRLVRIGEIPEPGVVVLAASNDHLELGPDGRLAYTPEPLTTPYRPSADVLFSSLAAHCSRPGVGVLLTGMGTDGARGLLQLRQAGWHTIAQNEETCVVYGMPRAAVELGGATEVLPLSLIGPAILSQVRALPR